MLLNPDLILSVKRYGESALPLLVVDNFVLDADALVAQAGQGGSFVEVEKDWYPGIRKPADDAYQNVIEEFVRQQLFPQLALTGNGTVDVESCQFSIANRGRERLLPIQCIPHFDTLQPQQWAGVHYLFAGEWGGTGFFRHRATEFEFIDDSRHKKYLRVLEDEAYTEGVPPKRYLSGSTPLFEMIEQVPAQFNRAVFYPANVLHSGLVKLPPDSGSDGKRLTANCLFSIR